jgi:hypothetical protein
LTLHVAETNLLEGVDMEEGTRRLFSSSHQSYQTLLVLAQHKVSIIQEASQTGEGRRGASARRGWGGRLDEGQALAGAAQTAGVPDMGAGSGRRCWGVPGGGRLAGG